MTESLATESNNLHINIAIINKLNLNVVKFTTNYNL